MTTKEKLKKAEELLLEVRAEMMQIDNQPTWDELLEKEYKGCYWLRVDGCIDNYDLDINEISHHYQNETFAKARKWQDQARKVAMSFDGYKEVGGGFAIFITWDSYLNYSFVNQDSILLDSIAVFESEEVAKNFIQFCKDSGKIDDNNKIVLE